MAETPEELQRITVEYVTKRHEGDGPSEVIEKKTTSTLAKDGHGTTSTTSYKERDVVEGPLSSAGKH